MAFQGEGFIPQGWYHIQKDIKKHPEVLRVHPNRYPRPCSPSLLFLSPVVPSTNKIYLWVFPFGMFLPYLDKI